MLSLWTQSRSLLNISYKSYKYRLIRKEQWCDKECYYLERLPYLADPRFASSDSGGDKPALKTKS